MSTHGGPPETFNQITIVGTGLMGSSFAMAARSAKLTNMLVGVETSTKTMETALSLNRVDGFSDLDSALENAGCVVVATPPSEIGPIFQRIAKKCREGTLVMDLSSVKESLLGEIDEYFPLSLHFISVHPMTGSESSGPEAARDDFFIDEALILVPSISTRPEAIERADALWRYLGAKVYQALPARHDELVTGASHLPSVLAFALASTLEELYPDLNEISQISGPALRDMLRCSRSSPGLWTEILSLNSHNTHAALEVLITRLKEFQGSLLPLEGQNKSLKSLLELAQQSGVSLEPSKDI